MIYVVPKPHPQERWALEGVHSTISFRSNFRGLVKTPRLPAVNKNLKTKNFSCSLRKELVRPAVLVASLCACRAPWGWALMCVALVFALCVASRVTKSGLDAKKGIC